MHIGSGVFLLVLGAILSWGVADRVSGVNLHVIGLICMAGGVLAILFSLVTGSRSRGYSATRTATVDTATGTTVERVDVES